MQVKVIINCNGAAFAEGCDQEVGRILYKLGKAGMYGLLGIEPGRIVRIPLHDINGNTIGYIEAKEG